VSSAAVWEGNTESFARNSSRTNSSHSWICQKKVRGFDFDYIPLKSRHKLAEESERDS
jgi:hypothetical protein